MKGFIDRWLAAAGMAGALATTQGCDVYRNLADPCYPERYEYAARAEDNAAFKPQVVNGHVLDQTIWNYQFEYGSDRLTPGGMEQLAYLARRRPCPDPTIYLQTAEDVAYDPAAPARFADARAALDNKRILAIQNYLTAQTAGRPVSFAVLVHDPAVPSVAANAMGLSAIKMQSAYQGSMTAVGPSGATVAGVAAGAAAGAVAGAGSTNLK
jgi:hypothetical protein